MMDVKREQLLVEENCSPYIIHKKPDKGGKRKYRIHIFVRLIPDSKPCQNPTKRLFSPAVVVALGKKIKNS